MTQTVLLGDIVRVRRGSSPRPIQDYIQKSPGIPWVKIADATAANSRFITTTKEYIKEEGKKSSVSVTPGTLIMSNSATPGLPMIMKIDASVHDGWLILDELKDVDRNWLYYYLLDRRVQSAREASGSVFSNLKTDIVRSFKIELPDMETQRKVAEILWTIDEKIELNRRMNETLEQMGHALFRHYFVDNPEAEKWSRSALGGKIKPRRGKSLQSKNMKPGNTPVVSGGLQPAGMHNESNTIAPVITVSASGANAGFTALWDKDVWSADSSFIDTTITPHVYFYYLFLSRNQKRIYEMQTGSGQPHIYPSHLELLELPNAPEELIAEFNEKVTANFKKIEENKKQIQTLTTLRDTLLPRLISGKVKV